MTTGWHYGRYIICIQYIFCIHNISDWFATWVRNSLRLRLHPALRRRVIGLSLGLGLGLVVTAVAVADIGRHRRLNPSVTVRLFYLNAVVGAFWVPGSRFLFVRV